MEKDRVGVSLRVKGWPNDLYINTLRFLEFALRANPQEEDPAHFQSRLIREVITLKDILDGKSREPVASFDLGEKANIQIRVTNRVGRYITRAFIEYVMPYGDSCSSGDAHDIALEKRLKPFYKKRNI